MRNQETPNEEDCFWPCGHSLYRACRTCAERDSEDIADHTGSLVFRRAEPWRPVAGKNSFTEDQAKSRIQDAGYTDVSGLKLDDQGIWRAMASKDGTHGNVALDFQGNITMSK